MSLFVTCQVTSVDYSSDEATVLARNLASSGKCEEFRTDYVIVTIPLQILQRNTVQFIPPLPKRKERAIRSLGVGQLEKVREQAYVLYILR